MHFAEPCDVANEFKAAFNGQWFSSYREFEDKRKEFQRKTSTIYVIRDSAKSRCAALQYDRARFACVYALPVKSSRSLGLRRLL